MHCLLCLLLIAVLLYQVTIYGKTMYVLLVVVFDRSCSTINHRIDESALTLVALDVDVERTV